MLYVDVSYRNNSPYEGIELPAAPMWYSFAAVDKADVENITAVHRYWLKAEKLSYSFVLKFFVESA